MATDVISKISAAIIRRGHPITRYAPLAASDYIPGDWVYYNAAFECTIVDSAVSVLVKAFLLDFEPRVSSTKARKDIDNAIAIDQAPVIWGGATGPLVVAATCENPGATKLKGTAMMISSTAGDIEKVANGVDPVGGVATACNVFVWNDIISTDVVGTFLMY